MTGWLRSARQKLLAGAALVGLGVLSGPQRLARAEHRDRAEHSSVPATKGKVFGHLPISELSEDEAIVHALNRLAFGPRPGDIERIKQQGLESWIEQQLHPEAIDDSALQARLAPLETLRMSSGELLANFPRPAMQAQKLAAAAPPPNRPPADQPQAMLARLNGPQRVLAELAMGKLLRAVYSERQLEERMVDFWFNHFNVFAAKGADRWLVTSYERDAIRPHALGKFEDLLVATAKSPAMLFYLDNWMSVDPQAYARLQDELALRRRQAMAFGACAGLLRPFGLPNPVAILRCEQALARQRVQRQKPAAKNAERGLNENYARELMELHTIGLHYTQSDVTEVAKCFTGWTIRQPRRNPEFFFDERLHTPGKKIVLGHTIDAGGIRDGAQVLHLLAHDPRTAQFISLKLARHFVMDDPPSTLVDRMAQSFLRSGGDIRQVLRTMIYSPEFWSRKAFRAKVKTPFELVASALRATGADVQMAGPAVQWIARMGEPLYLCEPPNGYPDVASAWVSSSALLNRMNFAVLLASNHLPGIRLDTQALLGDDVTADPRRTLERAFERLLSGQVSEGTRAVLEKRLADPEIRQAAFDDPVRQVNTGLIVGLVLGSPEFQRE